MGVGERLAVNFISLFRRPQASFLHLSSSSWVSTRCIEARAVCSCNSAFAPSSRGKFTENHCNSALMCFNSSRSTTRLPLIELMVLTCTSLRALMRASSASFLASCFSKMALGVAHILCDRLHAHKQHQNITTVTSAAMCVRTDYGTSVISSAHRNLSADAYIESPIQVRKPSTPGDL